MKLAREITVEIGGEVVVLRPSLRLALRVFREHDLEDVVRKITEGHLGTALELIAPHFSRRLLPRTLMEAGVDNLTGPLLEYVCALAGIDPDAEPEPAEAKSTRPAKPVDMEQSLTALYRIGTGWIGWAPQDTLEAAPAEIVEAYTGRLDMLKALFGGGEKTEPPKDERPLDDKFRTIFAAHGTVKEPA